MSLKIRLARGGAKRRPVYRVVIADSRMPRDGRFIEKIGTYNPVLPQENEHRLRLKTDRVQHWIGVGARPTNRVARLLADLGLGDKPAVPEQTKKNQPKAKAQERLREAEEAAKAAAEAAEAEAAAPAEEAPAEEAPAEEAPAEEAPAEEAAAKEEAAS